jgi:clorobiocin biosynthesis protein CloN7
MLIGHPMGTAGFAPVVPALAGRFRVVTYDPRGFARSSIEDREQDGAPEVLADDVRRVLEAVGGGPAHVFGSSGGAVTGLALVARHPGHVRTLVAHEPPVALLLPDAEQARAGFHDVYDTYSRDGIAAAWQRFSTFTGVTLQRRDPASPPPSDVVAMSDRFFRHGLLPIAFYTPDFTVLCAAKTRIVVAGGTTSRGQLPHRTATALSERLGTPLVEFPGGHAGFASDPEAFAEVLRPLLA